MFHCIHKIVSPIFRLHRDESGSISIVSVFALILLTMLLGLVMNSGRQVDQKVKMQNAADAATYAGGTVIVRNMNTISFTNHLLCDVFALTAFMREARDRNAQSLTPDILANWQRVGPAFVGSEFEKFDLMGQGIVEKVPQEANMVATWSDWAAAASELMLPVLEEILEERQIPEFQRDLIEATSPQAQTAANEIAQRHGRAWPQPTLVRGAMWKQDAVGALAEVGPGRSRVLPVVDVVMDPLENRDRLTNVARQHRRSLSFTYLEHWNAESLMAFDRYAKMSQFSNLWRIFTAGQLDKLLEEEYPDTNLPIEIASTVEEIDNLNEHLEDNFTFVGVVYRQKPDDYMPGVFRNPLAADSTAYAQVMMFVPRKRLLKGWPWTERVSGDNVNSGAVPGEAVQLPSIPNEPPPEDPETEPDWIVYRQRSMVNFRGETLVVGSPRLADMFATYWNTFNQNWTMQLVPATLPSLPTILSAPVDSYQPANLGELTEEDVPWLSHH